MIDRTKKSMQETAARLRRREASEGEEPSV